MKDHTSYCMILDTNAGLPKLNKAVRACADHNHLMHRLKSYSITGQIRYRVELYVGKTQVISDDSGIISGYATRIRLEFTNSSLDIMEKESPDPLEKRIQKENGVNDN